MAWYQTQTTSPSMKQIVIIPERLELLKSNRMLMLSSQYLRVYKSFWMAVLFKLDNEQHPTLMIKANESTEFLKDHPFRIGLSFIKGDYGNLFAVFVEFNGPYPFNCPTKPLVVFEDILGMDYEENRESIRSHLNFERLNIWLAEGGSVKEENDIMVADSITVTYEGKIEIEPDCSKVIAKTINRHIDEHLSIGHEKWDFQATMASFAEQFPISVSPILSEDGGILPLADYSFVSGERAIDHVVIFVQGNPGFTKMPDSMQNAISEKAKLTNMVFTSETNFTMIRNSTETIKIFQKEGSIALIAIMELFATLQKKDSAEAIRLLDKCEEFYLKKSGLLGNKVPESVVVMIPELSEIPETGPIVYEDTQQEVYADTQHVTSTLHQIEREKDSITLDEYNNKIESVYKTIMKHGYKCPNCDNVSNYKIVKGLKDHKTNLYKNRFLIICNDCELAL